MSTKSVTQIKTVYLFLMEVFIGLSIFFLPISKALIEIGTTSALVLWLGYKTVTSEGFLIPRLPLVSYLIFFVFCAISLIPASFSEWQMGIRGILKWLQYIGFFFLCAEWFTTQARVNRALFVFLTSMTLITFNGFYQLATGTDFLRHVSLDPGRTVRMKSSLGAPNTLAAFYLFAIPLAAASITAVKKIKPFLACVLIFFCAGFLATFSRAAFLGLFAALTLTLGMTRKWKWLGALLFLLAATFLIDRSLYENFIGSLNFSDITVNERLQYWSYTWQMIQAHPWTGVGLNLYLQKLPGFIPAHEVYRGYAHNCYLQMWAEIGLLGLLSFLFPLIQLLGLTQPKVLRPTPLNTGLVAGCLAFVFQALFDNHFYSMQPAFLFWIFFGMLTAQLTQKSLSAQELSFGAEKGLR